MTRRRTLITAAVILALMAGFGAGVNRYLASKDSSAFGQAKNPTQDAVAPQVALPGTIYFADGGGLYALRGTKVTQLQPQGHGWTEPVLLPGGNGLLAVKVTANYYSDLYELNLNGGVVEQLSHDQGKVTATEVGADDWIYFPAVGPDNTLYFGYDYPKAGVCEPGNGYQVDFSIWSTTLGSTDITRSSIEAAMQGASNGLTQVSWSNYYTGGDVSPVPLTGGGLIYVDYESAYQSGEVSTPLPGAVPGTEVSQIRMDPKIGTGRCPSVDDGTALTQPQDDCAQPALSPDQTEIAMVCTPVVNGAPSSVESDLVVATFDAQTGSIGPLDRIVTGTVTAVPAWSSDGRSLLYLAPESGTGYFELWYLKGAATATPSKPVQITSDLDLDATSAPVWTS